MDYLPLLPFAIFFAWLLFGMQSRVPCPDCGQVLSGIQSPLTKTKRQWIEGGFHCTHCGCESDVSGNKVVIGAPPKHRSVYIEIALFALVAVPAVVMFAMLLRY